MYNEHFGFFKSPFSLSPHLQFLFRSNAFEETMAHLVYGLESGEDIILITGEIGTGKTLALHNLSQHIPKTYRAVLINVTLLDFHELLKMLMAELGMVVPAAADRADLLNALKAELVAFMHRGQRLLLIIDEAHNLDDATLEGVRLLTNLGQLEEQALQVVLSGQPGLRNKINSPQLSQLRQRIRVHYHLEKLGPKETADYLAHRVKVAGCERNLFRKDAIQRIHALSAGIPRLVNVMADRALLAAYVDDADEVHLRHVEEDKSLARSPAEESMTAAIAAQSSESPPAPEVAVADVDVNVDKETEKSMWMAVRRFIGTARRILTGLLIIVAVAMALIAHYQGMIKLPLLPEHRSVAEVVADEDLAGENEGRPLDIASFDSLGFIAVNPDDSLALELPTAPPGLYVHVGSFREFERAEAFATICADHDLPTQIVAVRIDGLLWYQVHVGPCADETEARQAQVAILEKRISTWYMIVRIR